MTESVDIDAMEECASRVVSVIEKIVSAIKNVEAFAPLNPKRPPLEEVELASVLEKQGLFDQVIDVVALMEEKLKVTLKPWRARDELDVRSRLIHLLFLPLLESLAACYRLLDKIPQPPPPPRTKSKKGTKPPPPRGMLSIQNYTDIAALLEVLVCTSLLPCLEKGVLQDIRDRAQYMLPKSLAGRVSRVSLLWGTAICIVEEEQDLKQRSLEIQSVATVIGNIVLLDRFRPMLLPRHLADLCAGIFQVEELGGSQGSDPDFDKMGVELISSSGAIDSFNQARALQTLLLRGMNAPLWLRKRVSSLLADLATRDIHAIVLVFVKSASASQEDMTSASLRLAKALAASDDEDYYSKLCRQLVELLDFEMRKMDATHFAGALTVFAFVDQLPKQRLIDNFLPILMEGTFDASNSTSLHCMVRRVIALMAVIPPSHDAEPLCKLLFSTTYEQGGLNTLGQLVRLASLDTVEDVIIKSDAITALRMICSVMGQTRLPCKPTPVDGTDFLCGALIYAIAPTQWDLEGNWFKLSVGEDSKLNDGTLCSTSIGRRHVDEAVVLSDVDKRANMVVREVIAFLGSDKADTAAAKLKSSLPQTFFQHLLLTVFSFSQDGRTSTNMRLTVMITLPLLCEQCTPETLLLGTSSDATGILTTFKLILDCGAACLIEEVPSGDIDETKSDIATGFDDSRDTFMRMTGQPDSFDSDDVMAVKLDETLLSTTSIILSLLTAVLELGSGKRSSKELTLLKAMSPSLRVLSSFVPGTRDSDTANIQAEIAEMASHAAVLIASQQAPRKQEPSPVKKRKSVSELVAEAEREIKADSPAIRAEGAVKLRHLVRGFLVSRGEQLATKPRIVDMEEPLSGERNDEVLEEILRVAMLTLADPESYVYLAGIQTIVAIVDVRPQDILSKIAHGVCSGSVRLDACEHYDGVDLSQEERIKLAEALLFAVRRRGAAINVYVPQIMGLMVYGKEQATEQTTNAKLMQEKTHDYFIKEAHDDNELTLPSDRLNSKSLRLNTGGPIFEAELNDVLRSSCIAVVTELINSAMPSSAAVFVPALVKMVSNALHLDVSRPVRRASALLAVSLYEAALRELEEPSEMTSLTTALVDANEETMKSALEGCLEPASSSHQLYDPATAARCEEALRARSLIEDTGALAGAVLYLEAQRRDDLDPTVTFVKTRLMTRGSF